MEILLASSVDPDQMPHYVASDQSLDCWLMALYRFPGKNGISMTLECQLKEQMLLN